MKFIIFFVIFIIFYSIFSWIIKKINLHRKLLDKPGKGRHTKFISALILILFGFSLEYGKQVLNDLYGQHNYISIILGALVSAVYINFIPLTFKRNNS